MSNQKVMVFSFFFFGASNVEMKAPTFLFFRCRWMFFASTMFDDFISSGQQSFINRWTRNGFSWCEWETRVPCNAYFAIKCIAAIRGIEHCTATHCYYLFEHFGWSFTHLFIAEMHCVSPQLNYFDITEHQTFCGIQSWPFVVEV